MEGTIGDDGSSPLVRGQHRLVREQHHRIRIIPARAGPTPCSPTARTPATDHPRSCGANCGGYGGDDACDGSSPLVRGQPVNRSHCPFWWRIIPARAGPTSSERHAPSTMTDHPRSCGANAVGLISAPFRGGSSPLVRGQPPAGLSAISPRGSSPLVRGQRYHQNQKSAQRRIIPARAGPTVRLRHRSRGRADHPRSCGANSLVQAQPQEATGSSPLVRGQPRGNRLS